MSELTYTEVGATAGRLPDGYRHVRAERVIGHGRQDFERASDALLVGELQRRSRVIVQLSDAPVREGTVMRMRRSGEVTLSIVAFSRPARWFTRLGAPFARLVQARMTQRYLRALTDDR